MQTKREAIFSKRHEDVLGGDQVREVLLQVGSGPNLVQLLEPLTPESPVAKQIEKNGGRIFSNRAERALKYFSPDGTLSEIVGIGRHKKKDMSKQGKIVHVAVKVNDLEVATKFYENVFGFKQLASSTPAGSTSTRRRSKGRFKGKCERGRPPAVPLFYWSRGL